MKENEIQNSTNNYFLNSNINRFSFKKQDFVKYKPTKKEKKMHSSLE